jgi:hypothetical protein
MIRIAGKEFYKQMQWNKTRPWQFGLEETSQIYPKLTTFRSYVEKNKHAIQ